MNISLDYDETYTRDPIAWDHFISLMKSRGHTVYCVTLRSSELHESLEVMHDLNGKVDAIFFTNRSAKRSFMSNQGLWIDVWIDDMPIFIDREAK
jgi:hypothetical protein